MFTTFRFSGKSAGEELKDSASKKAGHVAMGTTVTAFGIAFLTINERRDVRQEKFREHGEKICRKLDVTQTIGMDKSMENKLIHACGFLESSPPPPKDMILGVSSPDGLRIRRKVEMYQWVETRSEEETTDSHGNKTTRTIYTYKAEWRMHPERCVNSFTHQNPPFPLELQNGVGLGVQLIEAGSLRLGHSKTVLGPNMVRLVTDFVPLSLDDAKHVDDPASFAHIGPAGLRVVPTRPNVLYTVGSTLEQPRIGDIKVTYEHVEKGEYTCVGQWNAGSSNDETESGGAITTFDDHVDKHELADQAEIVAGEEAQKFAKRVGYKTFIIPPEIIEFAESIILDIAPIRIALVAKGTHSQEKAFDAIEKNDEAMSTGLRLVGCAVCCLGTFVALNPIVGLIGTAGHLGSVGAGALIARQTIKTARAQIGASEVDDEATGILDSIIQLTGSEKKSGGNVADSGK